MAKKQIRNINWKYDKIQRRNRIFRSISIGFTALCFLMVSYYFIIESPGKLFYQKQFHCWALMYLGGAGMIWYYNSKIDQTESAANAHEDL